VATKRAEEAEASAKRQAEEEEATRKEAEAARLRAEEEAAAKRRGEEEEAARKEAEDAKLRADEAAGKKKAEDEAARKDADAANPVAEEPLQHKPSVGTWLVDRRAELALAARAAEENRDGWELLQHRPSVGTWLVDRRAEQAIRAKAEDERSRREARRAMADAEERARAAAEERARADAEAARRKREEAACSPELKHSGWLKRYGGFCNIVKQDRWVEVAGSQLLRSAARGGARRLPIDLGRAVVIRNPDGVSFTVKTGCKAHTFIAQDAATCDIWISHMAAADAEVMGEDAAPPAPVIPRAG